MVLKLIGLGYKEYVKDRFNDFDAIIVVSSLLELIFSPPSFISGSPSSGGAISALRSFRLFRVFRMARNWKSLRVLLITIVCGGGVVLSYIEVLTACNR
jgi:voltage-dependent calcium channel L type alpha-1D